MGERPTFDTPPGTESAGRVLVGCYRGMGDLLYVSSILAQMRQDAPTATEFDLAAGSGLWVDAVRHLPCASRIIPIESWNDIPRLGASGRYARVLTARVSEWMPFSTYRGWSLRARLARLHLIDVLARTMGVRLRPEHRRPVYFFSPTDPEDDPAEARSLGRFALVALHGFTHGEHNAAVEERLLTPLLAAAPGAGWRLVLVGPPGPPLPASPAVVDRRGAPIRRVATLVREATLVVSVLNGIAVLADALARPTLLIGLGKDPLPVVAPVHTPPVAILGRPGRAGARGVDFARMLAVLGEWLGRRDGPAGVPRGPT